MCDWKAVILRYGLLFVCIFGMIVVSKERVLANELDETDEISSSLSNKPKWLFSKAPPWQRLGTGLEIAFFHGKDGADRSLEMVILRINPQYFLFSIYAASKEGESLSLDGWAKRYHLTAVINASMYLPDGQTSTGYLRSGEHINNGHIAAKFGAFFVCRPTQSEKLPEAALLDRSTDDWESLLPKYKDVVQNYRLISSDRRLLWNASGSRHAIAAIARDGKDQILFIHCSEPLTGVDFGSLLLALPIDVRVVMYVEGGTQAGLLLRSSNFNQIWMGRHPANLWNSSSVPLPNVIGIKAKE